MRPTGWRGPICSCSMNKRRTQSQKPSGESHAPAHLEPPQCQEAPERKETEEAPEAVKRKNALRYTEYLGMVNMERQITMKIL